MSEETLHDSDGSVASFGRAIARGWARLLLSLLVGAGALWLALRNVESQGLARALAQVDWRLAALCGLALALVIVIRVYRWRILLAPFVDLEPYTLARIGTLGLLMIFVLPLRLGELVRPVLLRRARGVPLATGLATIAVERVVDGVVVVAIFFVSLQLARDYHPPGAALAAAWGSLAFFGGGALLLFAARLWQRQVVALLRRLVGALSARLAERAISLVDSFCRGLAGLTPGQLALYLCWTLAFWAINALAYYALLRAFPFGAGLPVLAAFTTVAVIVLAILLPGPPGFLGPFQLGLVVGLGIFGVSETEAMAYGAVIYPLTALVQVALAAPFLLLPPRAGRVSSSASTTAGSSTIGSSAKA